MRPIDADAALKALRKRQTYLYDARDPELKIELSSAEAAINNLSTIQQEKAQLSKKSTTSDLIDRQQTLDALIGAVKKVGILDADDIKAVFDMLPTIQPVATDTNVGNNSEIPNSSDAVSRQQAIDALDCINGTEEVLRSLPSAQPEYEEVTPEEAASEIASGSIMSAWSWLNVIIQLKQMGYAICRKR